MKINIDKKGNFTIDEDMYKREDLDIVLINNIIQTHLEKNTNFEINEDEGHPIYLLFKELQKMLSDDSDFKKEYIKNKEVIDKESEKISSEKSKETANE